VSVERAHGYRLAATRLGDTLQAIAGRELGDAGRWPELVSYNGLAPPYIVDHLSDMEDTEEGRVLLSGTPIRIPSAEPLTGVSDPSDIFGTDMLLQDGFLTAGEDGDFALVADLPNLRQALANRLATRERELLRHPLYGNPLHGLIGDRSGPVLTLLAAKFAERTLRSDPRVSSVESVTATTTGDVTIVEATAVAIDGRSLPVGSA
jgi:phage baseplate assembly protein W